MGRRSIPSTTQFAAVRAYFGLTQQELARFLGVTVSFISHIEAGRSSLPDAVFARLLPLARHLPPDVPVEARPVNTSNDAPTDAPPVAIPIPAREPLTERLADCRYHAERLRRRLLPAEARTRYAARWQAVAPALLAELPPAGPLHEVLTAWAADPVARRAGQRTDQRRQLIERRAAPLSPTEAAEWHLLRLRAEALEAEAAALTALLAINSQ